MSALNDFFENRKFEFTEIELDQIEIEFKTLISNKFSIDVVMDFDCDEGTSVELFWLTQVKCLVNEYEFIIRGDDDGNPVLDIVHQSNILGVYYPKNSQELENCIQGISL